jgi:DNA-binding HxlR family transcriptional regulator
LSASEQEKSRAELFEILGHPSRVSILEALGEEPLGFAGLKRKTRIASNGLLSFHIGKMGGLVCERPEGGYALTDQGEEALAIIEAVEKMQSRRPGVGHLRRYIIGHRIVVGVLVIIMVIIGSVAMAQQGLIPGSGQVHSSAPSDTVQIGGVTYWYKAVAADTLDNVSSLAFHGVVFSFLGYQLLTLPQGPPVAIDMDNLSTCSGASNFGIYLFSSSGIASSFCFNNVSYEKTMFHSPVLQLSFGDGGSTSFVADMSSNPAAPGSLYIFGTNGADSAVVLGDGTPSFAANHAPEAGVILDSQSSLVILLVQE